AGRRRPALPPVDAPADRTSRQAGGPRLKTVTRRAVGMDMSLSDTFLNAIPEDWGAFGLTEEPLGESGTILTVAGELDIATAPELRGRLTAALQAGKTGIVVDLREVAFMDSVAMA